LFGENSEVSLRVIILGDSVFRIFVSRKAAKAQRKALSFSLRFFRDLYDLCGDSLLRIDSPPNALGAEDAKEIAEFFSVDFPGSQGCFR